MLSTSTHRPCGDASFTVSEVLESKAARAAFTDLPLKSGIFPPFADGGAWSLAGHVSSSLTVPKSSLVSVDVLVDDNIDTVNAFPGEALLVTRSYNRDKFTTRKRVANLAAVPRALVCLYGIHVPVTGIPIGTI